MFLSEDEVLTNKQQLIQKMHEQGWTPRFISTLAKDRGVSETLIKRALKELKYKIYFRNMFFLKKTEDYKYPQLDVIVNRAKSYVNAMEAVCWVKAKGSTKWFCLIGNNGVPCYEIYQNTHLLRTVSVDELTVRKVVKLGLNLFLFYDADSDEVFLHYELYKKE